MFALLSFFIILVLSLLVVRVATVALSYTGLSQESARFQARSAYTGTGFTTSESEKVVSHPVRRRIIMLLMLLRSAGIVTAVSTLILSFVGSGEREEIILRLGLLLGGVTVLWIIGSSQWLDRRMSQVIAWALKRWTNLDVRDYRRILHLAENYAVTELQIEQEDWLAEKKIRQLNLPKEGVLILGIQRNGGGPYLGAPTGETVLHPGDVLILYGRSPLLEKLDQRPGGWEGYREHLDAVAEQSGVVQQQDEADVSSSSEGVSNRSDGLASHSREEKETKPSK